MSARQLACKKILIGRTMVERVAQETERIYLLAHRTDIVERAANQKIMGSVLLIIFVVFE